MKVLDKYMDELLDSFQPLMRKQTPFWETLETGISAHFDFLLKHPSLPAFLYDTIRYNPELIESWRGRITGTLRRIALFHGELIRKEMDAGRIRRVDPVQLMLDIVTLNILEEYLQSFKGCLIVVSHDRYFMDKVVDHLWVFNGQADIRDFPGNYTQYRDWKDEQERQDRLQQKQTPKPRREVVKSRPKNEKRKLSYKERRELEQLEHDIEALEEEKKTLEQALCSGTLSVEELTEMSKRLPQVSDEIETKTLRWMELSELEES